MLRQLPEIVRCVQRSDAELVLMMPAGLKMEVLRVLLAMPEAVLDVEVTAPGLQQLYGQLVDTVEDPA